MPPIYYESSFEFEEGEGTAHTERYPEVEHRLGMWSIVGFDAFDGESYPLAIEIGDEATARMLARARLRKLEIEQPSAVSGGQSEYGIQDRVFIVDPEGRSWQYIEA